MSLDFGVWLGAFLTLGIISFLTGDLRATIIILGMVLLTASLIIASRILGKKMGQMFRV